MALLAIVPARGGSRGVPRKVLQPVGGRPLILHTLETVSASGVADRIVVSSEDAEILSFCRLRGYQALLRPAHLSGDLVPLDAVVRQVVAQMGWSEDVAVFQPTCPFLGVGTIQQVVKLWQAQEFDWAITAVDDPHIFWRRGQGLITDRLNRQELVTSGQALQREVGAVQLMTSGVAWGEPRRDPGRLPIPETEALDIDTCCDLAVARHVAAAASIRFEVVVNKQVGSGHLYRALRLAEAMLHHRRSVKITNPDAPDWAEKMVADRGLAPEATDDDANLVVLDCLDTAVSTVARHKSHGKLVLSFEDEGPGALHADLVVNELLPRTSAPWFSGRVLRGPDYAVLRPEFLSAPPHPIQAGNGDRRVLISFGGTDPAGLNARFSKALDGYQPRVLAGPGAPHHRIDSRFVVVGAQMAEEMHNADLLVTSQGRTQFEAAAMGIPTITIAANERESRHVRCPGHLHLGLHATVSDARVAEVVARLFHDPALRQEMSATARRAVDDQGVDRILWHIEGLLQGTR